MTRNSITTRTTVPPNVGEGESAKICQDLERGEAGGGGGWVPTCPLEKNQ